MNNSSKYEKLYSSVHCGDLIKEREFPLFQSIVPLMLGFIGLFVSLYQTMSTNGVIRDSLIDYLKILGLFVLFASLCTLITFRLFKEGKTEEKRNLLEKLSDAKNE